MRVILFIIAVLVLVSLVLVGEAYVRFSPLEPARFHQASGPEAVGDWPEKGRFTAVLAAPDPQVALEAVAAVARQAPRTRVLAGEEGAGHISFVTRSVFWGFPDVTNIWVAGERLHIAGHLVYGRSDFGVNRARVEGWLRAAGLRE